MPAAAVIPAPGVHGTIAETKTSVVGTRTASRSNFRHARSGLAERDAARPRAFSSSSGGAGVGGPRP